MTWKFLGGEKTKQKQEKKEMLQEMCHKQNEHAYVYSHSTL